jgi:hypothetical protein
MLEWRLAIHLWTVLEKKAFGGADQIGIFHSVWIYRENYLSQKTTAGKTGSLKHFKVESFSDEK